MHKSQSDVFSGPPYYPVNHSGGGGEGGGTGDDKERQSINSIKSDCCMDSHRRLSIINSRGNKVLRVRTPRFSSHLGLTFARMALMHG